MKLGLGSVGRRRESIEVMASQVSKVLEEFFESEHQDSFTKETWSGDFHFISNEMSKESLVCSYRSLSWHPQYSTIRERLRRLL